MNDRDDIKSTLLNLFDKAPSDLPQNNNHSSKPPGVSRCIQGNDNIFINGNVIIRQNEIRSQDRNVIFAHERSNRNQTHYVHKLLNELVKRTSSQNESSREFTSSEFKQWKVQEKYFNSAHYKAFPGKLYHRAKGLIKLFNNLITPKPQLHEKIVG